MRTAEAKRMAAWAAKERPGMDVPDCRLPARGRGRYRPGGSRGAGAAGLRALLFVVLAVSPARSAEAPPGFSDAASIVPGLVVDMRYAGPGNFVGARIDGYEAPRCILTTAAAEALARVVRRLEGAGYGLKVFDCYRPQRAVAHFVRWSRDAADLKTKPDYYPDLDKRRLFALGYIASRSGHSRGSTVDLTLVDRATGAPLDMGGKFDFFGPLSASVTRLVTPAQQENRNRLREAMQAEGFRPYAKEWWHFTLGGEPFPETYFDFPVR
jgi:D-alanyl-D-alanine dipeptidase